MTDYSELKRLAEAALRNWPDSKIFERPECDRFIDAARPDVVLGLIERATAGRQHHLDSEELRSLCRQRDQFKAENEALRKALTYIRDTSDDWHVCENAADALVDAAMSKADRSDG